MAPTTAKKRKPQARAEDSAAFGPIAERFRRAGDLDRAVSLCREGLQKFPDHISARVTLGWALLDLGNFNEARTELEVVLRRAPDNLSAIRGLAELHDRSEHTMDLPMDGPGQWPPNPESIEQLEPSAEVPGAGSVASDDIVDEAVWVPAGVAGESHELNGVPRHEPADPGSIPATEQTGGMWAAVTPANHVEPEISLTPATGMSSMREIDPNAGVVSLSAFEEPAAAESAWTAAADPIAAIDVAVDLQALIAEADTLEAAADVASVAIELDAVESADTTLLLDAGVDLAAFDDAAAELTAGFDAAVEPEPPAAFAELDSLVASAEPEPAISSVDLTAPPEREAITAVAEPDALTAGSEPEAFTAPAEPEALIAPAGSEPLTASAEPEAATEPELVAAPAEELTAAVDTTPSFALTPWDETMAVDVEEDTEEAVPLPSPFDQLTPAFDFETVPAPVAAESAEIETADVVSFVPVAAAVPVRSPLPALERFLGRVQRRRLLVAESVA